MEWVYVGIMCKQFAQQLVGSEIAKCHMVTERCTRQLAPTAEKNVMFLSSQTAQDQFTAENATLNVDHHEDTKRKL
jgi:hypothetical protein